MNEKDFGKPIGIIRKIDHLGRFVMPMEIRKYFDIKTGDELGFIPYENGIFIKKVGD